MTETAPKLKVWLFHVLVGVPVAAFLHSVVQFAYEPSTGLSDAGYFLLHFGLGMLVGAVILVPAYTIQALLFLWMWSKGISRFLIVTACAALQAVIVLGWWAVVGLQPSLGGRFQMGPVMTSGAFVAGAAVSILCLTWLRRKTARSTTEAHQ